MKLTRCLLKKSFMREGNMRLFIGLTWDEKK
jgi:hypothetical protein